MKVSTVFVCLVCFAVGFLAAAAITVFQSEPDLEVPPELMERPPVPPLDGMPWQKILDERDRQIANLLAENTRLHNRIEELENWQSEVSANLEVTEDSEQAEREKRRAEFRQRMIDRGRERLDRTTSVLASRLNLSEDQLGKLKTLQDEMIAQRLNRDLAPEQRLDFEAELASLLTPEQFDEYQEFRQEQREARNEAEAGARLAQMGPILELTDAQKDQVFAALYYNAQERDQQREAGIEPTAGDTSQLDQAMAEILTPEQMKLYRELATVPSAGDRRPRPGGGGPPWGP